MFKMLFSISTFSFFAAICDDKIGNAACRITYTNDVIITRSGTENNSGGNCTKQNQCTDCNDGFYSDGPYCKSKCLDLFLYL
jgi:hypothetical protein